MVRISASTREIDKKVRRMSTMSEKLSAKQYAEQLLYQPNTLPTSSPT